MARSRVVVGLSLVMVGFVFVPSAHADDPSCVDVSGAYHDDVNWTEQVAKGRVVEEKKSPDGRTFHAYLPPLASGTSESSDGASAFDRDPDVLHGSTVVTVSPVCVTKIIACAQEWKSPETFLECI